MIRFYCGYLASFPRPHIRRRHVDAAVDNEQGVRGGYHVLRHTDSIQILRRGGHQEACPRERGEEFCDK